MAMSTDRAKSVSEAVARLTRPGRAFIAGTKSHPAFAIYPRASADSVGVYSVDAPTALAVFCNSKKSSALRFNTPNLAAAPTIASSKLRNSSTIFLAPRDKRPIPRPITFAPRIPFIILPTLLDFAPILPRSEITFDVNFPDDTAMCRKLLDMSSLDLKTVLTTKSVVIFVTPQRKIFKLRPFHTRNIKRTKTKR